MLTSTATATHLRATPVVLQPPAVTERTRAPAAPLDRFEGIAAARSNGQPTALRARGLGFDVVEPKAPSKFPALAWLDPLTYHPADPSKLPAEQASELAISHAAQDARTPEQDAIALDLAKHGANDLWLQFAKEYRHHVGPLKGWAGTALLEAVVAGDGIKNQIEKLKTNEPRPFEVDPTLHKLGGDPGGSSYPSGHAMSAYAAATVMSSLWPERKAEFFAAAADVARSRVYAGVHFAGDVAEGAREGVKFANDMLKTLGRQPVVP